MATKARPAAAVKEQIKDVELTAVAIKKMTRYGKETNEERSLPEVHDGLKPVHRRVLYSMFEKGLHNGRNLDKSAEIIGDTMGKYHPHGDNSIYGALVTMVNQNVPPVIGEGNWGSIEGDDAAAMRYCFVGSTRVMTQSGLRTFDDLASDHGVYKREGKAEFTEFVAGRDQEDQQASHILCAGQQETLVVTARGGYTVQCTPNEPFLTITESGYKWKRADELAPTDWLCMKRGTTTMTARTSAKDRATATVLGYLVGDGYLNKGQRHIGFNQVASETFEDFVTNWCYSEFGEFDYKATQREPSSYGVEPYNQFYCNSVQAISVAQNLGLLRGDSYDRCVPDWIWRQNRSVVGMFLSALFEADGSVFTPKSIRGSSAIYFNSCSSRLIEEMRTLLRVHFGIFAGPDLGERFIISGSDNVERFIQYIGFRSERKRAALVVCETGRSNFDSIPYADCLGFSRGYACTQRTTFRKKVEAGEFDSPAALAIYRNDYYYAPVENVEAGGIEWVYDLSVPANNSFTANGFVVHNTNARLSAYGASYFDPYYMPVLETVPNYNDKRREPLVLLAKLPNLLINGVPKGSIGTGVTSLVPTLTLDSAVALTLATLAARSKKETLTAVAAARLTQFTCKGGGTADPAGQKEQIMQFVKTGIAAIEFQSRMTWDEKTNHLLIDRFASVNVANKKVATAELDVVAKFKEHSSIKEGFRYGYTIKKLPPKELERARAQIANMWKAKEHYKTNVVLRKLNAEGKKEVDLRAMSMLAVLEEWVTWRIDLEVRATKHQVGVIQAEIRKTELLRMAVAAVKWLAELLKMAKPDDVAVKMIMSKFKVTEAEANFIFDLSLRRLNSFHDKVLKDRLDTQNATLKELTGRAKDPIPWIIKNIQALVKTIHAERAVLAREAV